jgi:hypothetical protein
MALLSKGENEAALKAIQQVQISDETLRLRGLVMAYHALGQMVESDAALTELIDEHGQHRPSVIAELLAYRGEADRAFEWLDKAVDYKDTGLIDITWLNLFTNIHDDPRWLPFLESIGKAPEQLDAIEFKVTLPK